ncbi:MAG TPA: acyl-CoA desaturase [Acidimicrobiales bacterium]|nr:acyl-CoA desaturase [Acidimicrobiales bacterium]
MQTDSDVPAIGTSAREEFAELSRRVRAHGLFRRRGGYYAVSIPATVGALVVLAAAVVALRHSWWILVLAVAVAFVMAQISFIGHDAGHRQVWSRRRGNDAFGLVLANLLSGFSFGWWLGKHTRHHGHTNDEGKDPDIVAGALVFTPRQVDRRGRFGRGFARTQQVTVVPLLFLEALNLHVASIRALVRRRDRPALVEAVLLVVHAALFFVAPFLVLAPLKAALFVVVTQALFGFYLGISFLVNHVGMPSPPAGDELGFLRRQVLTSRNLSGPRLSGYLFGGLDSQIEHHLFPTMPRANLRRARAVVRPFCAEHSIAYTEQSPWHAYRDVLRHLHRVGSRRVATVG